MDVKLPDGTIVKNIPDGTSKADLVAKLKANGMNVPDSWMQGASGAAAPQPSFLEKALRTLGGVGENVLHAASGAVAQPVAGIAGLGAMANSALGLSNADPSKVVADTQNALTYDPKTASGQAIQQGIGRVTAPIGNFVGRQMDQYGQNISDATGSPLVGALAKGALGALPQAAGMKLPEAGAASIADAGQAAVAAAPRQAAIDAATQAGYHLPPSEIASAPVGKFVAGLAGKDDLNKVVSLYNQGVTNKLAKSDLGIPADVPLDQAAVAKVKSNANAVYDQIKKADQTQIPQKSVNGVALTGPDGAPLTKPAGPVVTDAQYAADVKNFGAARANVDFGTPIDAVVQDLQDTLSKPSISTKGLVDKITELRQDARTNLNATDDVAKRNLGNAQQQAAAALEGQLGRYLQQTNQPGLLARYQQARTTLAKAHTIEDAMDAGGRVDASKINKYRNNGGYVEGGLKQIADAADSFKNVVKNTEGVQAPAPISALGYTAMAAGMPADMLGGHGVGAATGAVAAALAARDPMRRILNSGAYQSTLKGQIPSAGPFSQLAAQPASPLSAALAVTPSNQ